MLNLIASILLVVAVAGAGLAASSLAAPCKASERLGCDRRTDGAGDLLAKIESHYPKVCMALAAESQQEAA